MPIGTACDPCDRGEASRLRAVATGGTASPASAATSRLLTPDHPTHKYRVAHRDHIHAEVPARPWVCTPAACE